MPDKNKLDQLYMDIAGRIAQMSAARRLKVGAVLVKDDNIISMGWNGTPAGQDNCCEHEERCPPDSNLDDAATRAEYPYRVNTESGFTLARLTTKDTVLHAESNALMKLVATGGAASAGATMYVTCSPCAACAKLIKQAKIDRVVYRTQYRLTDGIELLRQMGITVEQIQGDSHD